MSEQPTDKTTTDLKPCPFCGSGDVAVFVNLCMCRQCGACSEDLGQSSLSAEKCKQLAVEAWNTRVS